MAAVRDRFDESREEPDVGEDPDESEEFENELQE